MKQDPWRKESILSWRRMRRNLERKMGAGCIKHFQVDGTCWMKAIVELDGNLGTHKGLLGAKLKIVTGPYNGGVGAEFHRQWNPDSSM